MTETTALARTGTYHKPTEATKALVALANQFPIVCPGGTPQVNAIPEGYGVSVTSITPVEGDTFVDKSSGDICFHAAFLKRLAAGLGLEWDSSKTRRLDNFQHPFVCSMVVEGRYRDYTGEWRTVTGSHMLDLRDEAAHGKSAKELPRARKSIQQLCETMAKSRAIADACVSRTMAENDQGRPIVMAKVYRTDPIDPGSAREALYGRGEPEGSGHGQSDGIEGARSADAEIIDHNTGEVTRAPAQGGKPATQQPEKATRDTGNLIGKGFDGEGTPFALATTAQLAAYRDGLAAKIESGQLSGPHAENARAKLERVRAEINSRAQVAEGGDMW